MKTFTKSIVHILLLSVFFIISGSVSYALDSEYSVLEVGVSSVSIVTPGEIKYYSFTPIESGSYTLCSTGAYDTFCTVYDSEMRWMNEDDDENYDEALKNFRIEQDFYAGQTYYFAISFSADGDDIDNIGGFPIELTLQSSISDAPPTHISSLSTSLSHASYTYDGTAKFPAVSVYNGSTRLKESTDYYVNYFNENVAGTATARIYGLGKYYGYKELNYTIARGKLSADGITLSKKTYTYNGKAKQPSVTLEQNGDLLFEGLDYTVSYSNNINAGTATVSVKAKSTSNYKGTVSKNFTIKPASVVEDDTSLEDDTYIYTGKTISPAVYIGDKKVSKKDYTISSRKGGKATGPATVTISFKRNYSGAVTHKFKIVPKTVVKSKIKVKKRNTKGFTVTWKKAAGATGYLIYITDPDTEEITNIYTKKTSYRVRSANGVATSIRIRSYKKIGKKYYLGTGVTYSDVTKPKKPKKPEYTYDSEKKVLTLTLGRDDLRYKVQAADNKALKKKKAYKGKGDTVTIPVNEDMDKLYLRVRYYIKNSKKKIIWSKWTKVYTIKL